MDKIYAYTASTNLGAIPDNVLGKGVQPINASDSKGMRTGILLRAMNMALYGDYMGMPGWVFVDCCLFPSAFVMMRAHGKTIPEDIRDSLNSRLDYMKMENKILEIDSNFQHIGDNELIPTASYLAIPSASNQIVGFSFTSMIKGNGKKIKAYAYSFYRQMLGCHAQIGIAQYFDRSVATHTKFGDLRIINALELNHSIPDNTFSYSCQLPSDVELQEIIDNDVAKDFSGCIEVGKDDLAKIIREISQGKSDYFVVGQDNTKQLMYLRSEKKGI
jgi:hypothetical protein